MINESLIAEDVEGENIGKYDTMSHHLPGKGRKTTQGLK
jgi:hypothetical protein